MTVHNTTMNAVVDKKTDEALDFVRTERSRNVSREERLLILRLHATMRARGENQVTKSIVNLTGRSGKIVKEVWSEFYRLGRCTEAVQASNMTSHLTRVPDNIDAHSLVQEFVRQRRLTRTRTVAKDVMAFLIEQGHVRCDQSRKKDVHACLRAVRKFLARCEIKPQWWRIRIICQECVGTRCLRIIHDACGPCVSTTSPCRLHGRVVHPPPLRATYR